MQYFYFRCTLVQYHSRYLKAVDLFLEIIAFYANYFPCALVTVDQFLHNSVYLFAYISASVCVCGCFIFFHLLLHSPHSEQFALVSGYSVLATSISRFVYISSSNGINFFLNANRTDTEWSAKNWSTMHKRTVREEWTNIAHGKREEDVYAWIVFWYAHRSINFEVFISCMYVPALL